MKELKQKMQSVGITAYRLSQLSGVSQSTISRILKGTQKPLQETYEKLIKALE